MLYLNLGSIGKILSPIKAAAREFSRLIYASLRTTSRPAWRYRRRDA